MRFSSLPLASLSLLAHRGVADNFTIAGGQIFTPGFAVLDSPQPGTPLGGDQIEVALDISANGKLNQPPYDPDSPSRINNITIFLYSYDTGRNFTITNGSATPNDASLGNILESEPGSTVKHVKWTWPACLIGDGKPDSLDSDRGEYNISIRQNFRLNGEDHYTIFDVPISVTNRIEFSGLNPQCDAVDNPMLSPEQINATAANSVGVLFAPGDATVVQQPDPKDKDGNGNGLGLGEGPGGAAGAVEWRSAAFWISLLAVLVMFAL